MSKENNNRLKIAFFTPLKENSKSFYFSNSILPYLKEFADIDILASNFTGYQLEYVCHYTHRTVHKPIYVDTPLRNLITKYTNEGRNYTLTNFTTYKDYIDRTKEAFPGICKKDVETILKYG